MPIEAVRAFDYRAVPGARKVDLMERAIAGAPERFRGLLSLSRAQLLVEGGVGPPIEEVLRGIESSYGHDRTVRQMLELVFPAHRPR